MNELPKDFPKLIRKQTGWHTLAFVSGFGIRKEFQLEVGGTRVRVRNHGRTRYIGRSINKATEVYNSI